MRLLFTILIILLLVGCSTDKVVNSLEENKEESVNNNELNSVDELNETVWEDSKEAFDILVKRFEDIKSVSEEEFQQVDQYFEKYYDNGYVDVENSESLLVNRIYTFSVFTTLRAVGTQEEQNERMEKIQELYMEIDQMFK